MSRPIEQALNNLIPRHPGALPPELIELAGSLLAQSRNKCTLKPEEDIARTYLCANIACERLKQTLNLPPIEPRPPIPPRVYKKLYTYFESTLKSSRKNANLQSLPTTPSKATPPKTRKENPPLAHQYTPSKHISPSKTPLTPLHKNRTPKASLKHPSNAQKSKNIPKWLGPVTRHLCHKVNTPKAIPHIIAGVESILNLPSSEMEIGAKKLPALIAAVWFFVVVKMRGRDGVGMEDSERKKLVREVIWGARTDPGVGERVGEDEWEGWGEIFEERDVGVWRRGIVDGAWRELDWFLNVKEGEGVEGDDGEDDDEVEEAEEVRDESRGTKRKRQVGDKYDYLNEARLEEYEEWKTMILKKIEDARAQGAGEEMDVGED